MKLFHSRLSQTSKTHIKHSSALRQRDQLETQASLRLYTGFRYYYLPYVFSIPLTALAARLLPHGWHHHFALTVLIGFGIGIPAGEVARYLWKRWASGKS